NKLFDVPMIGSGELGRSPRRGPGRKGGGLVFQSGETLDIALSSEFQLDEPHMISFWLKLPPKVGRNHHEEIMHFGWLNSAWRVSANFGANRGERGALRLDCGDSYVVGSTDIADGNWHHIAYRYLATSDAEVASQIHLFVDGKPEVLSDFQSGSVLAGRVGNLRLGGSKANGFQGWIDDLTVFREAASTATIQALAE
ncbi:MAG: LamG-like jellyroll fold domain-containing protein, partial [Verrucomicrobiales bacterium]